MPGLAAAPERRLFALARALFRAGKHAQINHSGSQPTSRPMPGQTACESPREFVGRFGRESEGRAGNSTGRGRQGPDQVPDAHLVWHGPVSAARFQHAVEGTAGKKFLKDVEWRCQEEPERPQCGAVPQDPLVPRQEDVKPHTRRGADERAIEPRRDLRCRSLSPVFSLGLRAGRCA